MQRIMPQPGTPAAELARLADEERQLAEREADMLDQGVEVELRAREVQVQLDAARASLQRLANTSARSEAEQAFLDSLSLVVPPHVASQATSTALELRRKALIARLQAVEAEGQAVRERAGRLADLSASIAGLQVLSADLMGRVEAERRAAAAQPPIPLTPVPPQAPQAPAPAPVARKPAGPVYTAPPAAWSRGPTQADREREAAQLLAAQPRVASRVAAPSPVPTPVPAPAQPRAPDALYSEARRESRMRVHAEVTLGSESNFYTGFSGDLSEGGVFVATYEKLLPPGTAVELAVALPNRPPIKVTGKVRWVREPNDQSPGVFPGMGIQFDEVQAEALAAIKSFLQRREPMFWDEG